MTEANSRLRHPVHLASLVPGRLRIRFRNASGNAEILQGLQGRLKACEGLHRVDINTAARSMTLHYDHARHGIADVLRLLEDVDVIVESVGHLPSLNTDERARSLGFVDAANDLNGRLRRWTHLPVDLKTLIPLSLLLAGLWSTFRKGLMIESVPGWLFLWLAFDMFVKLNASVSQDDDAVS